MAKKTLPNGWTRAVLCCERCQHVWKPVVGPATLTSTCPACRHNHPLTNEARAAQDAGRLRAAGMEVTRAQA